MRRRRSTSKIVTISYLFLLNCYRGRRKNPNLAVRWEVLRTRRNQGKPIGLPQEQLSASAIGAISPAASGSCPRARQQRLRLPARGAQCSTSSARPAIAAISCKSRLVREPPIARVLRRMTISARCSTNSLRDDVVDFRLAIAVGVRQATFIIRPVPGDLHGSGPVARQQLVEAPFPGARCLTVPQPASLARAAASAGKSLPPPIGIDSRRHLAAALQALEHGVGDFLGKAAERRPFAADQRDDRKGPVAVRLGNRRRMIAADQSGRRCLGRRQGSDAAIGIDDLVALERHARQQRAHAFEQIVDFFRFAADRRPDCRP